ncbi:MAG: aromatic ring-hydroxylating dioxygenase subunit alpha [Pirellulales bacterium]
MSEVPLSSLVHGRGYKAPYHVVKLPCSIDPYDSFRFGGRESVPVGTGYEEILKPYDEASHMPGYMYWHPDVLRAEVDSLFMKEWLMVARREQIEEVGDYFSTRIVGESIIIARNKEGKLNAFYNRCAHRGVAMVDDCGHRNTFSCPYHAWSYDLEGRLIGAPHMREIKGFDPATVRLKSIALREWAGWVFVNFSETPPSFDDFIKDFAADFSFLQQDRLRLAETIDLTVECNWKFMVENLVDNYHTPIIHRNTIGRSVSTNDRYTGDRDGKGAFTGFYTAKTMTRDERTRFRTMPWLQDRGDSMGCSGHLVPNVHLFGRSDHVHVHVIWPIHPTKMRLLCYQLFPDEFFKEERFAEKVKDYTLYNTEVLFEDSAMIDSLQQATTSPNFVPGRLSQKEKGVYNVINETLARTFPRPG